MLAKYFILTIYFFVLFFIGYVAARKVTNIKDYFVGGKAYSGLLYLGGQA